VPIGETRGWRTAASVALRVIPLIALTIFLVHERPWRLPLGAVPKPPLLLALALNVALVVPFKALRWRIMLDDPPPFLSTLAASLEGQLATITVGFGSGDVVRAARLRGRVDDFGPAMAQHATEQITMCALVLIVAAFGPLPPIAAVVAASLVALFAVVVLLGERAVDFVRARGFPRVASMVDAGLAALSARKVAAVASLALAGWGLEILMIHFTLGAFGLPSGLALSALMLIGINAAVTLPGPPANVGTFEAGAVAVLYSAGARGPQALAFALGYHLLQVVPTAIAGAAVFLARGK
jgi:uncharacterized membrane protein YbhN (UPF0104 family)